ncbi:hypothetical protein ABC728_11275 (plasmid) [Niveispirillum fermenti]
MAFMLSYASITSIKHGFNWGPSEALNGLKIILKPDGIKNITDFIFHISFLIMILAPGAFIFYFIIKKAFGLGPEIDISRDWAAFICIGIFIILPIANRYIL